MKQFCKENGIQIAHGSPRTPTTQGLVERANRTWKENARAVIMSKVQNKVDKWCKYTLEISYTMNITYHSAIKTTPYEATFGFKAHRENTVVNSVCCKTIINIHNRNNNVVVYLKTLKHYGNPGGMVLKWYRYNTKWNSVEKLCSRSLNQIQWVRGKQELFYSGYVECNKCRLHTGTFLVLLFSIPILEN